MKETRLESVSGKSYSDRPMTMLRRLTYANVMAAGARLEADILANG
jgi:hypothetical protein